MDCWWLGSRFGGCWGLWRGVDHLRALRSGKVRARSCHSRMQRASSKSVARSEQLQGSRFFWLCLEVRFFNIVYSAARFLPLTFVTCLAAGLSSVLYWSLHVNRTWEQAKREALSVSWFATVQEEGDSYEPREVVAWGRSSPMVHMWGVKAQKKELIGFTLPSRWELVKSEVARLRCAVSRNYWFQKPVRQIVGFWIAGNSKFEAWLRE